MPDQPKEQGRERQRRRTRKAIVDAAMKLIEDGHTPSVSEIADLADVSRRTVYMYFPSLEPATGKLVRLEMIPTKICQLRVNRASAEEARWLKEVLNWEGERLGTNARPFMKMGAAHLTRGLSMTDVFDVGTLVPELVAGIVQRGRDRVAPDV